MKSVALGLLVAITAWADTAYYQRVLFDNSLTPDNYFYSSGNVSSPSRLKLSGEHLPVDTQHFHTPPNALQLQWTSHPEGGWTAEIQLYKFRNRNLYFPEDTLTFWLLSSEQLAPDALPNLTLRDTEYGFTHPLPLTLFAQTLAPNTWTKIAIPLRAFHTASLRPFQPHRTLALVFVQGNADRSEHTMALDDIQIESSGAPAPRGELAPVESVTAKAYERHIDITWKPVAGVDHYVILRSRNGEPFHPVAIQVPGIHRYADWVKQPGQTASYQVQTADSSGRFSKASRTVTATTQVMSDDELLTMVQEACFHYYWDGAQPDSGMTRENLPGEDDIVATGASGFGIMAIVVGVERGFITRQQGIERLARITAYLQKADRYHGVWPHFTNGRTGQRVPVFGMVENGADLVETSFLLEGLLTARQYFHGASPAEQDLARAITSLWQAVDWNWFRRTPDGDALIWHWSPEYAWYINHPLIGFNETMITYLEAIASPTHSVPPSLYYTGWAGQSPRAIADRQSNHQPAPGDHYSNGHTYEGIKLDVGIGEGGPLFFTHYSYLGFDPHFRDRFTDYFDNNRNQALINRAYCIRNPGRYSGYGPECWGITAVDGPKGYSAYEPRPRDDDGTIAPTGAIASMPYTPEPSMRALKFYYRELGNRLWGEFGFRDAFNLQQNWFSGIYMGLNQAPMIIMIENHRTGLLWKSFMANPEIQSMMQRAGFTIGAR